MELYKTRYYEFNVKHFHEKLSEEHGIRLGHYVGRGRKALPQCPLKTNCLKTAACGPKT